MTSPPSPAAIEPIAYLTVEVKQRELDARLLIAAHLLKMGLPVVIGQQWSLFYNAAALPPGIVLFKTVNGIQGGNLAKCRADGHLVAATDEEVLICMEPDSFARGFSPLAAQNCDLFLAQNEFHKLGVEHKFPHLAGKIEVVGNSRVDLIGPASRAAFMPEAKALREKHGRFILFNTNFGTVNSVWGRERAAQIAVAAGTIDPKNEESLREYQAMDAWEQRNLNDFILLLRWTLANLPEFNVVVRTHPAEVAEFWQKELAGTPAVVITGSVPNPWLLAADLSVHTGSTTGLEAMLMGRPVVNLSPTKRPDFEPITNWVNPTFARWDDAAAAMTSFLRTGTGPVIEDQEKYEAVMAKFFPGYRDASCSRTIAEKMIAFLRSRGVVPTADLKFDFRPPGFTQIKREPALRDKMTVSPEEMSTSLVSAARAAGLSGSLKIQALDDSLFLIVAKA